MYKLDILISSPFHGKKQKNAHKYALLSAYLGIKKNSLRTMMYVDPEITSNVFTNFPEGGDKWEDSLMEKKSTAEIRSNLRYKPS